MARNYKVGTNNSGIYSRTYPAYCGSFTTLRTISAIMKAPCPEFTHVQMVLQNHLVATTPTLQGALVAVTNTATTTGQKVVPSTGNTITNNSATGWSQVTFSNGAVTTPTLPAVIVNDPSGVPGVSFEGEFLFSDWIACRSIQPNDNSGNNNPYLMYRTAFDSPQNWYPLDTDSTDKTRSDYWEAFQSSATDATGVTSPSTMTTGTASGICQIRGINFRNANSGTRNIKIMAVGDSITQGYATSTGFRSWTWQAERQLQLAGFNITIMNEGWVGCPTVSYNNYGIKRLGKDKYRPNIVLYSMYSPNDLKTQADMDAMYSRGMQFADTCKSLGIQCIFTFLLPWNTLSLTDDNIRKGLITRTKAQTQYDVLDMTQVTGNSLSPEDIIAAYDSGDGIHANDIGNEVMGNYTAKWLTNFIYRNAGLYGI
jgi:lysophospholipase L1-like esterase